MADKRTFWVVEDTHLGHDMLVREGHRPDGFDVRIIASLAALTKPGDVIIHLGDICFYREDYWHGEFTKATDGCHRWLAKGNHDKKSTGWYLDHGWSICCEVITINIFGKRVALSHRPLVGCQDDFDINLHGHLHNDCHHCIEGLTEKNRLLYMEHDYRPVNLRKILGV